MASHIPTLEEARQAVIDEMAMARVEQAKVVALQEEALALQHNAALIAGARAKVISRFTALRELYDRRDTTVLALAPQLGELVAIENEIRVALNDQALTDSFYPLQATTDNSLGLLGDLRAEAGLRRDHRSLGFHPVEGDVGQIAAVLVTKALSGGVLDIANRTVHVGTTSMAFNLTN